MNHATDHTKKSFTRFVDELSAFIRIPGISAQPGYQQGIKRCATWLADHLRQTGLDNVQLIPSGQHPLVYADWLHAPGQPTLLIYGHYDVQPVDPVHEWKDPPFSGKVNGSYIYGRGSSDDKGQLFAHVKAIESYLATSGQLPINIKCLFEGEEETGSAGLQRFIQKYPDFLAADVAVISDMRIPTPHQPAITYSLRGMLSLELRVTGQQQDLHSGTFGGVVYNPFQALCEILAAMHDRQGRITIPGFYDGIRETDLSERQYMKSVGPDDATILQDAGAAMGWGEQGYSAYERTSVRPSLSINGISGGYQGEGPKSIIPSKAAAKLSFRLVPGQDPEQVEILVRNWLRMVSPAAVKVSLQKVAAAKPVITPVEHPCIQAAAKAYEKAFSREVVFLASGGTIPVVNVLQEHLAIPAVLMGFALPTDNLHGPNERFSLSNFYRGILTSIFFMRELTKPTLYSSF